MGLIAGLFVAQQFVLKNLQSDNISDFSALDEASKVLIKTSDLMVIRNPYVILGLFLVIVFILFVVYKMPQTKEEGVMPKIGETFQKLAKNKKYAEAIGMDNVTAGYYQMVAFILFTVGRAFGTYLLRFLSSGKLLMLFALAAVIFSLVTIVVKGMLGLYSLVAISFFMSLMFPTIYGIALGDLTEEQSKVGSAGLVMAIVGGALMPKLQGMIIDAGGNGVADLQIMGVSEVNFSFILPLLCFAYIFWFGLRVHRRHEATDDILHNTNN